MPGAISYYNFDLVVRRTGDRLQGEVLRSPAGEATADFEIPFSRLQLQNFVLRLGPPRRGIRRISSSEAEAAKDLGKGLYDAVFSGDVGACWHSSLSKAESQNAGLRLRLRIENAPELNEIPWEYLYSPSLNRFLSLSERTPLIRYLDIPEGVRPLAVDGRLEILVMISSPADFPGLDAEDEWARLNAGLAGLIESGRVHLERLEEARLLTLQRTLRRGEYHVLHFIGHGGFDSRTQDGVLVFCDEFGRGRHVPAERLATILHDHRSLRLVVLNACEGSRSSPTDRFAGVAQTLVQQGVPAVVAMQFEISDQAAITFSDELYVATADGYPIDAAVSEARKALDREGYETEWGTPVLYLRADDSRLFKVNRDAVRQAAARKRRAEVPPQAEEKKKRAEWTRPIEEKQPTEAARLAQEESQGAALPPSGFRPQPLGEAAGQSSAQRITLVVKIPSILVNQPPYLTNTLGNNYALVLSECEWVSEGNLRTWEMNSKAPR